MEVVRLAETVKQWWPQVLAFIELNITNAGDREHEPPDQDPGTVARGFRNVENQRRRVRSLAAPPDEILAASYAGAKPANMDVENLLLYNID